MAGDVLHDFGAITLSGGAGTVYSASELDLGTITATYRYTRRHLGNTRDIAVEIILTTALATGTSVQFFWASDDSETSTTKLLTYNVVAMATGLIGYRTAYPAPIMDILRYNRIGAVISGAMDAGIARARLVIGPQLDR